VTAKRDYFYVKSAYYRYQGQWDLSYDSASNLIDTYSQGQVLGIISTLKYKKHLCTHLVAADHSSNFSNYLDTLNKLEKLSFGDDIKMFNTVQFKKLIYHIQKHDFELAGKLSDEIDSKWDKICTITHKTRQLAYCYNIVLAYWWGGRLKDAVYWLSKILSFENHQEGQRYVNLGRTIQLPLFYDFQDENLDNRIESTRKVLRSRGELNDYRKVIISSFRQLIRCLLKEERKSCIIDMHDKLLKIQNEQNINAPDLEVIIFWCNLQVNNLK